VACLTLMPLYFIAGIAVLILVFSTEAVERRNYSCQQAVLRAQKLAAVPIEQLLKLNPIILSLRAALKMAYATLAFANITYNAPLAAKATEEIAAIKLRQVRLHELQQSLIRYAQIQMFSARGRFQAPSVQSELFPGVTGVNQIFNGPAVEPTEAGLVPATYRLKNNFEREQLIQLNWSARWTLGEYQWITKWIGLHNIRLQRSCAATLQETDLKKLKPSLIKAKFS
jgi:hypothetical protein